MLSHLVRRIDIDRMLLSCGNVSGDFLNGLFLSLKPYRLTQQKYLRFLEQLGDAEAVAMFLRMEQWIFDSPALAGRACGEFARDFYQGNKLVQGEVLVGGRRVDLAAITMPVLNIYARDDHLVPPAASKALGAVVGSRDYTEVELPGGHIGVYVGLKSPRSVPSAVSEWMSVRR
jgi:polyhydroxyalkanoate synthase